ncbi:hypothetical protein ElyMa_001741900 [Elysia marginata]|uniref:Uncharacterized protein n=1 Tax=Elysia marginata TaxID=1093978 RepID=A0AAV4K2Q2_9GAST|nr:hypothetical protein ElyMa_001741900 [Elysia marginata]
MDQLLWHVWILPVVVALLLVYCQAQSNRLFQDPRLYPSQRYSIPSRHQQLWRPVYRRSEQPLDSLNPPYLGQAQSLQTADAAYLAQPAMSGNRVYIQSLYPNTRTLQVQRNDLSYLIPKITSSRAYLDPSTVAASSHSRFENPPYVQIPFLTTRSPQRFEKPSYLDPSKFNTPDMTLAEMEATLIDIERHTRAKEMGNPDKYTGSRVLILLLREQCARLALSGDPDVLQFCSQFDSRFRSFLF